MTPSRAAQEKPTSPRTERDHLLAMVEVVSLYKSQHDDECNCEACNAYEAATDEVEPWTPEAAAATPSLDINDGIPHPLWRIWREQIRQEITDALYRVEGIEKRTVPIEAIASQVLARLDEGSATPKEDDDD